MLLWLQNLDFAGSEAVDVTDAAAILLYPGEQTATLYAGADRTTITVNEDKTTLYN